MTRTRRALAVLTATVGIGLAAVGGAAVASAAGENPEKPGTNMSDGVSVPRPGRS